MSDQLPDPAASELAAKTLDQMLHQAQEKDLCPHCVGLDLIYFIARDMTANTDVDPGELFNVLHTGIIEGAEMQETGEDAEPGGEGSGWTVH